MPGAQLEVRLAPAARGSPWSCGWVPTSVSRCCRWPARRRAVSWPGRCWPSAWWVGRPPDDGVRRGRRRGGRRGRACLGRGAARGGVRSQVLVVTHLAQVASQADAQISVVKQESHGRTVTVASAVAGEERVTELSRMLSGHPGATPPGPTPASCSAWEAAREPSRERRSVAAAVGQPRSELERIQLPGALDTLQLVVAALGEPVLSAEQHVANGGGHIDLLQGRPPVRPVRRC